jgi:hypothetical protein
MWDGFAQELSDFARILLRHPETEGTGNALLGLEMAFVNSWKVHRSVCCEAGVPLPVPRNKGLHPQACEIFDSELRFVFELGGEIEHVLIPVRSDFQVRVGGYAIYEHGEVDLEDHWRVDTHPFQVGEPTEPHPLVHFQRGGHAQDTFAACADFVPGDSLPAHPNKRWLALLQSPGPRIPFPPFCPILAIDFAIGQHNGTVLNSLRNFPEYHELVRNAQIRLWVPFFAGLSSVENRKRWLGGLLLDGV